MRFLLLLALPALLAAQQPDCNLARRAFDNPFSDTAGYWLRRYQWHALRVTATAAAGEVIHRTTKLPRWASFTISGVAISVVPHIRGVIRKQYPFHAKDWAFDAFLGSVPLIAWTAWQGKTWQSRTFGSTTIVAGYLAGACFAEP